MDMCKECKEKEVAYFGAKFCSIDCMKKNKAKHVAKVRKEVMKRRAEHMKSIR